MTSVRILCVGKLKEPYLKEAQAEYIKRLCAFARVEIIEKKETPLGAGAPEAQAQKAVREESAALLSAARGALIALSPDGERMDSEAFSALVKKYADTGEMCFAVGGSCGLGGAIKAAAVKTVSFSDMTMPHALFRIVLLEQIYRAFMISEGRTYHK
jgi:23S rRNA (pseudouridine1915-N3)-methyltransferase